MTTSIRHTFTLKYKEPKLDSLKGLISDLSLSRRDEFRKNYGKILSLLNKKVDYEIISSLAQYYDPPLRCFTFADFQLAPTLEEVERIVGLKLKDFNPFPKLEEDMGPKKIASALSINVPTVRDNWTEKGGCKGFAAMFLEDLALKFKKSGNWNAFYAVLALLIHGIVLFPNVEKFVDQVAIEVFLSGNPVPFLLADIYYAIHTRHEKRGGMLLCCAPLLYTWFMQHMPEEGPFVAKELKSPQKLASLTASSIRWYIREWETPDIIGCINYNPMLSRLQHDYSMDGPPDAKDLQPFVLSDIQASNPDVRAVRKAWLKVVRMGKEFGKRNILAKEPYTQWMKERVEKIQLPYILKAPALPKTPEPEPILPEDMEKLVTKVKELEVENAELRIQMNRVILENQNLKEERKGKAQELEDSNKRARLLEDQKDDLDHILLGSTSVIRTRKEELKKAEYRICELGRLLDKSLMDKKEIKLDFEAQIRDLREALKKCEEKLSREILQKEEAERNCHHLRYELEEATRRFAILESQEGDAAYLLLKNDCVY
ncbi:uncharacterized protein LOC127081751 [Lathyrus oleraceus]|uniref:uncharacterized protein LOC127081751 n=1 Tax=Pisum sativum TaxID=3888 RepID=UPI0021D12150|nr:uncharacterized protein LOC127081751 [Pisum sativum]